MKKLSFILSLLLFSSWALQAQNDKPFSEDVRYKHVLKANPITMAFGDFNATWERIVSEKASFTLTGNFITGSFDSDFYGIAITAGYKYYFTHANKPVPAGFYVRPFAGILAGDGEGGFRLGGQLGYQWVWKSGFVLDLGLGPQIIAIEEGVEGPIPSFFFGIGYAF